jgi:hypothetical protein
LYDWVIDASLLKPLWLVFPVLPANAADPAKARARPDASTQSWVFMVMLLSSR